MKTNILIFGNGVNINMNDKFKLGEFFNLFENQELLDNIYTYFNTNKEKEIINIICLCLSKNKIYERILNIYYNDNNLIYIPEEVNEVTNFFDNLIKKVLTIFSFYQKKKRDVKNIYNDSGFEDSINNFIKYFINKLNKKYEYSFVKSFLLNIDKEILDFIYIKKEVDKLFLDITTKFITNLLCLYLKNISNEIDNSKKADFLKFLEEFDTVYTLNYDDNFKDIEIDYLHGKYVIENEQFNTYSCLLASNKKNDVQWYEHNIFNFDSNDEINIDIFTIGINPKNDENLFKFLSSKCDKSKNYRFYFGYYNENDIECFITIIKNLKKNIFLFDVKKMWEIIKKYQELPLIIKNLEKINADEILNLDC